MRRRAFSLVEYESEKRTLRGSSKGQTHQELDQGSESECVSAGKTGRDKNWGGYVLVLSRSRAKEFRVAAAKDG